MLRWPSGRPVCDFPINTLTQVLCPLPHAYIFLWAFSLLEGASWFWVYKMLSSSTVSTETSILTGLLSSKSGWFVLASELLNSQWGIVLPISVLFTALSTQTSREFCGPEWTDGSSGGPGGSWPRVPLGWSDVASVTTRKSRLRNLCVTHNSFSFVCCIFGKTLIFSCFRNDGMVRILGGKLRGSEKSSGTDQHVGCVQACNWERLLPVLRLLSRTLGNLAAILESLALAI